MVVERGVWIWWVRDVIIFFKEDRCCIWFMCVCSCCVLVKLVIIINCLGLFFNGVIESFIWWLLISEILWLLLVWGLNECVIIFCYIFFFSGLFNSVFVCLLVWCMIFLLFIMIMFVGIIWSKCLSWFVCNCKDEILLLFEGLYLLWDIVLLILFNV